MVDDTNSGAGSSGHPNGRGFSASVLTNNGSFIIFGGYFYNKDTQSNEYFEDVWSFNTVSFTWKEEITNTRESPKLGVGPAACYSNSSDMTYVYGGMYSGNMGSHLYSYNFTSNKLVEVPSNTTNIATYSLVMVCDDNNNGVLTFGGVDGFNTFYNGNYTSFSYQETNHLAEFSFVDLKWTEIPTTVPILSNAAGVYEPKSNSMYVFGGLSVHEYVNTLQQFHFGNQSWSILSPPTPLPPVRKGHVMIALNSGDLLVYGGLTETDDYSKFSYLNDVWYYNISSNIWINVTQSTGTPLPPRAFHTAVHDPVTDSMLFFGGVQSEHDFESDVWRITVSVSNSSPSPSPNSNSSPSPSPNSNSEKKFILIAVVIVAIVIVLVAAVVPITICIYRNRKSSSSSSQSKDSVVLVEVNVQMPKEGKQEFHYSSSPNLFPVTETMSAPVVTDVEIIRVLGEGCFGSVSYGNWKGTPVALKQLLNDKDMSSFASEASILRTLTHPNIVQFLGIFTSSAGIQYLVTEYIEKGSLVSFLKQEKDKLKLTDLVRMLLETAKGMVYLSGKNIVHRDLAARNLLVSKLDENYIVKISDFGLSRQTNEYTSNAPMPLRWSAPESIRNGVFNVKSDVYSFGVTMWEVLEFGNRPFYWISSNEQVVERVIKGELLPKPNNCPDTLYVLMTRCCAMVPENRPDFETILKELETLYQSLISSATPAISSEYGQSQSII